MDLDKLLQSIGLPDDLSEMGLGGAPEPDAAAGDRIRLQVLHAAADRHRARGGRPWGWVAAAAVLILALGLPSGLGWMQGVLRLVPGFGVQQPAHRQLSLAHVVRAQTGGDTIYVTGVLTGRSYTEILISIEGVDAGLGTGSGLVLLKDARGRVYRGGPSWWSFGGDVGAGALEFPPITQQGTATLILHLHPRVQVRLPLVEASSLPAATGMPTAQAHGVSITAQAMQLGGKTLFTLVATDTPSGTRAQGFGQISAPPRLMLAGGRTLKLQPLAGVVMAGPLQNYAAKIPSNVVSAKLVVPSVSLAVQQSVSVAVPVPLRGTLGLHRVISVGPATEEITRVERLPGYLVRLSLRGLGPAALGESLLSVNGQGVTMEERLSPEGAVQTMTFPVPAEDWWVTLTLATPTVVVQGPWRVTVPLGTSSTR